MSTQATAVRINDVQDNEPLLLSPYRLGDLELANRTVMAPMTRSRALAQSVPNPIAGTYYAQRAGAGLIVTEGVVISRQGSGYTRTPGIHSPEQVAAWKPIVEKVHAHGGKIFLQLWHVGRISHPLFLDGELPVAPSAINDGGEVFTPDGMVKRVTPRALETAEIAGIVEDFRKGAENAKAAGFDGVELHGANGYLLDQFTRDGTNQRTDQYGGSIENRIRFPVEATRAVISVFGANRVGYRISPTAAFNGMADSNPLATFSRLTEELSKLGIVYLHAVDPAGGENRVSPQLRKKFNGTFIVNGGFDLAKAQAAIVAGETDLVAFGVPFLANPDLPKRFSRGAALNTPDQQTFYQGEEKGFVDYPALG
ncbi:MAG TPA: alkene reductase [Xanthobacteraceae bacterium]|nr:alkene reductase [Xanthobacteraceae bacterium]